jgi:hypothetical protein
MIGALSGTMFPFYASIFSFLKKKGKGFSLQPGLNLERIVFFWAGLEIHTIRFQKRLSK